MKEKIVCVEWEDAGYISGYYDRKTPENFEPVLTRTVGHLIKRTSKSVIVSQDRFYKKNKIDDDRHIGIIPKKMIRRITELKGSQ
mgnify:CR=1 FL=1